MKPALIAILALLLLTACVSPDASTQSIDGTRFGVRLDDHYFWPDSFSHKDTDGTEIIIDVFPIVTALVVSRADGVALAEADEAKAREAVEAHCAARGKGPPVNSSRLADGAWAFMLCG
jgi:hypothetical protein